MPPPNSPLPPRRRIAAILGASVFALVFLTGWAGLRWTNETLTALATPASTLSEYKIVTIPEGASPRRIAANLHDAGLIRDPKLFIRYARWRGVDDQLKYGEYRLDTAMTPRDVLDRLVAGNVLSQRFTVREGDTVREVARELEARGLAKADDIMALAQDQTFLAQFGITAPTAEGYLFPETYHVAKGVAPEHLMELMILEFRRQTADLLAEIAASNYSPYEILTIASIIEKEALYETDMPLVSAVVYNRLDRNMLLQCDVTIRYPLDNYGRHLTYADLELDSPYNSYKHKGLPPTPICNPGFAALEAAVRPADTDYLYFVSMNNGAHHFSKTYREHQDAVRKYQVEKQRGTTIPSKQGFLQRPLPGDPPEPITEVLSTHETFPEAGPGEGVDVVAMQPAAGE